MKHPAHPDAHNTTFTGALIRSGCVFHGVESIVTAPFQAIGGILSGGKQPTPPAAVAPPPVPTVDTASVSAQQQAQEAAAGAQKKGALATLLNTGNTSTGDALGAAAPEATLKRFLGS